jgi:hypothetical protein
LSANNHISVNDGIAIIQFTEYPSIDLLISIIDELSEKELYLRRLWDFRGINFNFPEYKLREIADYGRSKFINPNKAAFVVDNDLEFILIRLVSFYIWEGKSKPQVFYDYDKAIEFLKT